MRLLDLLKRIEWSGQDANCPCCGWDNYTDGGHRDCELKAAIDHFEEVAKIPEAERTLAQVRYGARLGDIDRTDRIWGEP